MTKTIKSATDASKHYFIEIDSADHVTHCNCKGFQYRGRCHHVTDFNAEVVKASTFLALKAKIASAEREARNAARCAWELTMGIN